MGAGRQGPILVCMGVTMHPTQPILTCHSGPQQPQTCMGQAWRATPGSPEPLPPGGPAAAASGLSLPPHTCQLVSVISQQHSFWHQRRKVQNGYGGPSINI